MNLSMPNHFILCMLLSVTIASVSQILLKKSALRSYTAVIWEYVNPFVISGYGLLSVSMLLTVYAYSGMEYKNGPVIEAFGNVIVLVLSFIFFRERISMKKLVGIACVMLGMIVFYS